jgi:hypothetical protein
MSNQIENFDYDPDNAPSICDGMRDMIKFCRKKQEMYHEGTIVYEQYQTMIDVGEALLSQCKE